MIRVVTDEASLDEARTKSPAVALVRQDGSVVLHRRGLRSLYVPVGVIAGVSAPVVSAEAVTAPTITAEVIDRGLTDEAIVEQNTIADEWSVVDGDGLEDTEPPADSGVG